MKIYISGKISGLTEKEYKSNFDIAIRQIYYLKEFYGERDLIKIVNPLDIKPLFGIKKWLFYMAKDIFYLKKCTHICLMSNWKDSKGACIEHYIGKFIFKLEVIYL